MDRQRLQGYLRDHLADPTLSVASASAAMFMSVRYVQKLFAQVGSTPRTWLMDQRMSEAKRLLSVTDLPIAEVAVRVGYREVSQFSRGFKGRTGLSPSAYRLSQT
ncbi:helix-turn-helix transcriptional regulator [Dietzia sp. NCCP-2495]|uniref:helix-turn-helix transcriptional regulator n=1 Tax=Dietzia sp. NCCP-2495 TaxID=2934675 RepID=UPI00222E362A|nr:helix-turn-helix transcriptional regulator [Dietzia sp. NCCP-2495]